MKEKRRQLRTKIFLGSTTEEINKALEKFYKENEICLGNYRDHQLYKLGGVYQFVLIYAELVEIDVTTD